MKYNFRDRPVLSSSGLRRFPPYREYPLPQASQAVIIKPALQRLRNFQAKLNLANRHPKQRKSTSDNYSISAFTVVVLDKSNFNDPLPMFMNEENPPGQDPISLEKMYFTKRMSMPMKTLKEYHRLDSKSAQEREYVGSAQRVVRNLRREGSKEGREKTSLSNNYISEQEFVKYNRSNKFSPRIPQLPRESLQIQTTPQKSRTHRSPRRSMFKKAAKTTHQQVLQLKPWQNQADT